MTDACLIKLNAVKQILTSATDLQELMDIQRKVDAGLLYARRSNLHEAQNELAEAKIRIDRRIGQILAEIPKEPGKRTDLTSFQTGTRLQDLGIPKVSAHRWQQEAVVPDVPQTAPPALDVE